MEENTTKKKIQSNYNKNVQELKILLVSLN